MNKKILTITLITLTLVSGGFYFWNNKYDQEIVIQEQEELINNEVDTSDWQEYQNDRYSYSFAIPPGYISKAVYEDVVVSLETNLFGVNLIKDNSSIRVEIEESSLFSGQGNLNERFTKTTQKSGFKLRNFNGIIFFENDNLENSKLFSTIIGDRVLSFKFANVEEDTMKAVLGSFKFNQVYNLDTSDWKTYRNEELGIEFKYPGDWELEDNQKYKFHSIYLSSPETKKLVENKRIPYFYNIAIVYYPSILDEEENINSNNVEDLIAKNMLLTKIGNIKIGNKDAVDAVWGGHGSSYVILAMEDLQLYKVVVPRISDRNDLNSTEKTIINSFIFY